MEILFGKTVNVYRTDKNAYEDAVVIKHYGYYSDTCHRCFGGEKEVWNYPDLISVRFKDGKISNGHFVDERHYA